jgi:hypothetical protein
VLFAPTTDVSSHDLLLIDDNKLMTGWHARRQCSRYYFTFKAFKLVCSLVLLCSAFQTGSVQALNNPGPESGSIGLQGTISSAPPTRGATIGVPGNGTIFTSIPITVSGICPTGLLIKIFDNGIFVGSTICIDNSYTLQIDLFSGQNNLIARDYDSLDQPGPDSATITVTFNNSQFLQFGTPLTLSSDLAENGAPPGTAIVWPVQISGGTGPFAISVDWGDGSPQQLLSSASDGTITLNHTYKVSGIYTVVVKGTDKNGETAFLQLVGQATGAVQNNSKGNGGGASVIVEKGGVLWWPVFSMIPLIIATFWIGRRYELHEMRKRYLHFDE